MNEPNPCHSACLGTQPSGLELAGKLWILVVSVGFLSLLEPHGAAADPVLVANSATLGMQIDFDAGQHELEPAQASELQALADALAARVAAGEDLGIAIQAAADQLSFSAGNGNLATLRLGGVSTIFAAALRHHLGQDRGRDLSLRLRQQLLTDMPEGNRFVRIWVYEGGFFSIGGTQASVPDSLVGVRGLEDRLTSFATREDLAALPRGDDDNLAFRVGAGVLWDDLAEAAGPEAQVELDLFPDGGYPFFFNAATAVARLNGHANWRFGGGLGWAFARARLTLGYRRSLYVPEQLRLESGGITQSYQGHAHLVDLAAGLNLGEHWQLNAEAYGGEGYRREGDAVRSRDVHGVAAGISFYH